MNKRQFIALLRWEKAVEIDSYLSKSEAMARLAEKVERFEVWRVLNVFGARTPLVGSLTGDKGLVRVRDLPFSASSLRALSFGIEDVEGGSSLRGVLRLRLSLLLYEVSGLAFMCCAEISRLYWVIAMRHPLSLGTFGNLLKPLLAIPFLWCYIRVGLWIGRKREADLIEVVRMTVNPIRVPPLTPQGPRIVSQSTPTEILMRPRKSFDR